MALGALRGRSSRHRHAGAQPEQGQSAPRSEQAADVEDDAVVYRVVEHDGGWAYKVGDVFSETYPTRELADAAAERAASEQRAPGDTEVIQYQDEDGVWREETARGDDRPPTAVRALNCFNA
jgi:hypothetical protein